MTTYLVVVPLPILPLERRFLDIEEVVKSDRSNLFSPERLLTGQGPGKGGVMMIDFTSQIPKEYCCWV